MPEPVESGEMPESTTGPDSLRDGEMPTGDARRDAQESEERPDDDTPDPEQVRRGLIQEREARRRTERQLAALRSEYEKLQEANKSEAEKAISRARREGYDEAVKKVNARLVRAEAKAVAAAEGWRDPEDALLYVDSDTISVSEQGDVDTKAIRDALADIAKAKPYLLAAKENGRPRSGRPTSAAIKQGAGGAEAPDMDTWLRRRRPPRS